ncbi:hypothetical protein Q4591_18685 [Shewanella sp. 3_MG-2023]|uniref:hypothetical protein n=1 Tax=Shewanella sp. 3_MG-2023 TaxID=3062635 RepID=UPI0026E3D61E|nr:hypothetical protein [Shewanella sp. 3_MG-2023]MDO6777371.1 hypothetical protein [Shewanella sp. 3_MG-2023]
MQDQNEVLFPVVTSDKHPHTKEIILLAEQSGMTLTKISEILNYSQPYVSQLKSGKGKAKTTDLEPLITLLSPKLPGTSFYTYKVFRRAKVVFPDNWEQQVVMLGLSACSKDTEFGRYPIGDDSFDDIEVQHFKALDCIDENGRAYSPYNSPLVDFERSKSITEKLREALETYKVEVKENQDTKVARDEDLKHFTASVLTRTNIENLSDQAAVIEEAIIKLLKPRYEQDDYFYQSSQWLKASLVRACQEAADILNLPSLIKQFIQDEPLGCDESNQVIAPDEHAKRLLSKLESYQVKFGKKQQEKRNNFRLQKLFKSCELDKVVDLEVTDPRFMPDWNAYGQGLFGGVVRKVFREANRPPYEVNLSDAFTLWATNIEYSVEYEQIQVCGDVFHSATLSNDKIVIHELNSGKFIYILTFLCEILKCEVAMLSNPLSAAELLEQVKVEAEMNKWSEGVDVLIMNLKKSLSENGYRVSGVRAVY